MNTQKLPNPCKSPCGDPDCLQGCHLNKKGNTMSKYLELCKTITMLNKAIYAVELTGSEFTINPDMYREQALNILNEVKERITK